MRTHLDIIRDAGGYKALADKLGLPAERVRFWEKRESIPLDCWRGIAGAGVAAHEELFQAAEARAIAKRPTQDAA